MNDENLFASALKSLKKPQEEARQKKILFTIRKEIEWPTKRENVIKLREENCLKYIVASLKKKNNLKVIDISLSILGNCCMDQSCARDLVKKYDVLPYLNSLLLEHKYDSIYSRIFRIIGNICHHWERLANTVVGKQPELVDNIVEIIVSDATKSSDSLNISLSAGTIILGIRALRELLHGSLAENLIVKHNVIKAAGIVLVKYTQGWLDSKENSDILNGVLRFFLRYSKYEYREVLCGLQNTSLGNGMNCLGKLITLAPYDVVKIIMNLMKFSTVTTDLPVADVTQTLIEELKSNNDSKDAELKKRAYLKCACFLIQSAANREEMKKQGIITALIDFLRERHSPTVLAVQNCLLIVCRLRNCLIDDASIDIMIKNGIIEVLEEKLEWLVGSSTTLNLEHVCKKRKRSSQKSRKKRKIDSGLSSSQNDCPISWINDYVDCNIIIRPASPSSGSDISFCSGPSFTPSSPACSYENELLSFEDSDSDDYSPVCSDMEDIEENTSDVSLDDELERILPKSNNDKSNRTGSDCENDMETLDKNGMSTLNTAFSNEIVALIKQFAHKRPIITELISRRLLINLLKFLSPFHNSSYNTEEILPIFLEILKHKEHLLRLIQIDIIPVIHDLTINIHCDDCSICIQLNNVGQTLLDNLTFLAESNFGRGVIIHHLLRGNVNLKQKLALVIPYLIKNKNFFGKLMVNYGGLEILMKLLNDTNVQRNCIKSLCVVANLKGIKNPTAESLVETIELKLSSYNYEIKTDCKNIVIFELDDGSILPADRDFLTKQSDFFDRLLSGTFKESQEDKVRLCNVENKSLKCLFMLMEQNLAWPKTPLLDLELKTLLDVIVLTDRYLIVNLCNTLVSSVEKFQMSPTTAPIIYQWSLESGTNLLRVETVAYILVSNILESEKYAMFQRFFLQGYFEQLTDDIHNLLKR